MARPVVYYETLDALKWEYAKFDDDGEITNKGGLPLWSGASPPPAIDAEVIFNVGSINPVRTRGIVWSYFVQGGWVGVEVLPYDEEDRDKRYHLFGAELLKD